VRGERAHAARLGERRRLVALGLAPFSIESVGLDRDIAEQVQSIGCMR